MITIGEVLSALRSAKSDAEVRFDFGGFAPTTVKSWRGIYAEPAIGYEQYRTVTVGELIKELESAVGPEFHGYKGGKYRYTAESPLHVDNYREYTCTEISRIEVGSYCVILHTEHAP